MTVARSSCRALALATLAFCASLSSTATSAESVRPDRPTLRAERLTSTPVIDGDVLGDAGWAGLSPATGFRQTRPDEGAPASQRTEVFVGYTDDTLYVGVIAFDDDPSAIVVSDTRRDSSLDDADSFRLVIDGFLDRQNGLVFGTNPAGIQYDGQVIRGDRGRSSFNIDFDVPFEVASSIGDFGWSAEFEIPFSSLRYGTGDVQQWGINFQRDIRRNNERAFWAPLERQFSIVRVSDAGTLTAVTPPPVRNLQITPYALARARRGDAVDGTNLQNEVGVDVKYSITPSLTLDVSVNTDFAQVEVDDVQVNLNRFSLFFPEKRAFFLENAGQFRVGTPEEVEFFFSRRIGIGAGGQPTPIVGGARLSGKIGSSTNVGLLAMRTEDQPGVAPENDFMVARISQELPNRSSIGAIFVDRQGDGSLLAPGQDDENRTVGLDGRWGIGDYTTLSGWLGQTDTPGLDGDDHAYSVRLSYNSPNWFNSVSFTEVAEDFNPEVGFLARDDYRKFSATIFHVYRPEDLWGLLELRPHVAYRGFWDLDGVQESEFLHVDNHWEWRSSAEIHTGVNFTYERVNTPFQLVPGVFVPVGKYDNEEADLVFQSEEGRDWFAEVEYKAGGFFNGTRHNVRPTLRYRFGDTFSSELTWNYNRIDLPSEPDPFTVNVGQLRLSYSFTPKMLLQALIQYDDRRDSVGVNLRFSLLQRANAGLFLVYNEVDEDGLRDPNREIVLKYSYIFDVLR